MASLFIGSTIILTYTAVILQYTNKKNDPLINNIINECNLRLKHAKYSERLKFATLIKMRLNAYNTALKIRKECIHKLNDRMSMSLEDIIATRKIIKKMEGKIEKYNKKMSSYPVFQSMFAIPQKNDYIPISNRNVATNGETCEQLVKNTQGVESRNSDTESGISSITVDTSPACC